MAVIRQLNEHRGAVTAIVDVNGINVRVKINKRFKSHLERNKAIIEKAKELSNGN